MSSRTRGGRGRRAGVPDVVGVALILTFTDACRQILGVDDYRTAPTSPVDAGGKVKAFAFVDPTCGTCMKSSCTKELAACRSGELCGSWQDCMANCKPGDGACENRCFTKAGSTDGAMGNVAACGLEHCLVECQASGSSSAAGPDCASALRTNCGNGSIDAGINVLTPFAADPQSLAYTQCMFATDCVLPDKVNPGCQWPCMDANGLYAPGSKAMALANCIFSAAPDQCGGGNLACKGKYSFRLAANYQANITVFAQQGVAPEAPGLASPNATSVQMCSISSTACSPAFATAMTGPDGFANFPFATTPPSFEIEPGWPLGPKILRFETGRPIGGGAFVSLSMDSSALQNMSALAAATGAAWDPSKAGIGVLARDCQNGYIKQATFVLADQSNASIAYATMEGTFKVKPASDTVIGIIWGVEPGLHTLQAYIDGEKIAELQVVVIADSFTIVSWLEPLTTDQVGD